MGNSAKTDHPLILFKNWLRRHVTQKPFLAIWRFIIYFYCNYLVLLQREKDEFPGKINKLSLFVNRKVDFGISYYLNNFQKWVSLRVIISIVRSLRRITANLQDVGRRSYFKCRKVSQVKIGCLLLIVNRRIYLWVIIATTFLQSLLFLLWYYLHSRFSGMNFQSTKFKRIRFFLLVKKNT